MFHHLIKNFVFQLFLYQLCIYLFYIWPYYESSWLPNHFWALSHYQS